MSDVRLLQLELGPMANYVYLIGDPATKKAAIVDPAWDVPAALAAAAREGWEVSAAFATHHHHDHVNGVAALVREREVPVYLHENDAAGMPDIGKNLVLVSDGARIAVGETEVVLHHTPGHTEGSQCLVAGGVLLTGDTLFLKDCGRVDLPGSDPAKLHASLRRMSRLPDDLTVYPGHNYSPEKSAPWRVEKARNPYLQASLRVGVDEFRSLVL